MKKSMYPALAVFLLMPTIVSAGAASEQVVDADAAARDTRFRGVFDIDRTRGWEVGKPGGRFVYASIGAGPGTFNPWLGAGTASTDVTGLLNRAPVRRNQFTLEWEPDLAESWTVSADELTVTYRLRSDLRWSDGTPITAKDFVFAANHVALREAVGSPYRPNLTQLLSDGSSLPITFTYIDDLTYSVRFHEVTAGQLQSSAIGPAPRHVFGPIMGWSEVRHGLAFDHTVTTDDAGIRSFAEVESAGTDYSALTSVWGVETDVTRVLSSGPFVIRAYEPGRRVILHRNPHYYERDARGQQLPYLEEAVIVFVSDQDTRLRRFIAGQVDTYPLRGEDYAVLVDRQVEFGFRIYNVGPTTTSKFIAFNQNPIDGPGDRGIGPPRLTWLSSTTFRQAMAHLVDRRTIIDTFAFGLGYPQYSPIPELSPYHWHGAAHDALPYDPQRAARMLDSIDYVDRNGDGLRQDPEGNRISLTLSTNSGNQVRELIADSFAREAGEIGVEITVAAMDFSDLVDQLTSGYDWEIVLVGLTGTVDPIGMAGSVLSSGGLHLTEPLQTNPRRDWERRVDEAWVAANRTTDETQRKAAFETIQRIWLEEVPMVYTFAAAVVEAVKAEFGNIYPQPVDAHNILSIAHRLYVR